MRKRIIQGLVILAVLILIGAVFIVKRTQTGSTASMQETIDSNARREQEARPTLEITGFTPEMIQNSEKPMIIVMGESWCQPCLRMMPDLTELNRTVEDIEIRYMDLEENEAAFQYFPIRVTPTIAVFEANGKPFTPPEDSEISYILYNYSDSGEHAMTIHEGYLYRSQLETMIEELRNAGRNTDNTI